MVNRFRILGFACALLVAGTAQAQSNGTLAAYPARAVHWILPGAPGSPPDVAARIVGEGLAKELGQPVIVENRPGASGTIALAAVAKSAPDGYTLGMFSVPQIVAPSVFPTLAYDTLHDFVPVTQFVQTRFLLAVRADSPIRTVAELIATAKANPGRLTFSSPGNGSVPHLAGELLRLRAKIDIRHIPYKSGPFAVTALLGGQVDMIFSTPSSLSAHLKSGKLRALATLTSSRLPEYPDVPTIAQTGFPDIEMGDWFSIAAPAGTPRSIVDRLSAAVREVLAQSETSERLTSAGFAPVLDSGPDRFALVVQSELQRWATVVREAGIHAD
jgi:tripartite-type tricarboxylate transporter receptor subunit TctC